MLSQGVGLLRRERSMDLDELAMREHDETSALLAMEDHLTISALKGEADSLGDDESDRRKDKYADSAEPHDLVDREIKVRS